MMPSNHFILQSSTNLENSTEEPMLYPEGTYFYFS